MLRLGLFDSLRTEYHLMKRELAECFGNCCHYDQPQQDPSWRRTMPPETSYQRQIKRFTRLSQNSKTPEKSSRLRTRRNGFFEPRKPSQRQSLNIEGLLAENEEDNRDAVIADDSSSGSSSEGEEEDPEELDMEDEIRMAEEIDDDGGPDDSDSSDGEENAEEATGYNVFELDEYNRTNFDRRDLDSRGSRKSLATTMAAIPVGLAPIDYYDVQIICQSTQPTAGGNTNHNDDSDNENENTESEDEDEDDSELSDCSDYE